MLNSPGLNLSLGYSSKACRVGYLNFKKPQGIKAMLLGRDDTPIASSRFTSFNHEFLRESPSFMPINNAPLEVNTMLDGGAYPK